MKTELKYFYYYHMINNIWKAKTVWIRKGTVIGRMIKFLDEKYPNINSITEVPINKALNEYRNYLTLRGINSTITNHKLNVEQEKVEIKANSYYVTNLKQFMEFYRDYYYDGEEWDKDVWDIRNLDLAEDKINPTNGSYTISFTRIQNSYFKGLTKRYCKLRLNTFSFSHVIDIARGLRDFFNYIDKNHKAIKKIRQITREEIEGYLNKINCDKLSANSISSRISVIDGLLTSMSKYGWEDAPAKILFFPEDYPKPVKPLPRYIDSFVLEQLNDNLDKLPQSIAAMVMIIQECGMRISELCTLKAGCLIVDSEGDYFLKTYQWKMKKEHIVPISREIAAIIKNQEEKIKQEYGSDCIYLFPRKDGSPLKQDTFRKHLNDMAYKEKIVDRNGKIFRFHAHAFRHTVGTQMINNGVPQHIVQKFLGHESPEMTARYAHIHDETLKKEFIQFKEKLVSNRGSIVDLNQDLGDDNELQWFKKNINAQALPNGYCRLPVISGPCPHANACLDCTHFCTSKKFLQEHESHLQRTSMLLERAKQNQWQRQVESNERIKDRLEQIILSLKETE